MKKKELKRFYKQDEIRIVESEKYFELSYMIDIPSTYGFEYYQQLDKDIKEFFESIDSIEGEKPVLFRICGDFNLLKDAVEEDIVYFQIAIINIFISFLIKDNKLEREQRLGIPKTLRKVNLTSLILMDLINKELKFPFFSIEIVNENSETEEFETIYEVF